MFNVFILLIGRETDPYIDEVYYRDYDYLSKTLTNIEIEPLTTQLFRRFFVHPKKIIRTAELYGLFAQQPDVDLDPEILRERIARHFYHALYREEIDGHIQIIPHFYEAEYITVYDYNNGRFRKGAKMDLTAPDMKVIDKLIEDAMGWGEDFTFRAKVYLEASEKL